LRFKGHGILNAEIKGEEMRVAIIEDEKPNLRMLTDMLQKLRPGWEVVARLESVSQSVAFFCGRGTARPGADGHPAE